MSLEHPIGFPLGLFWLRCGLLGFSDGGPLNARRRNEVIVPQLPTKIVADTKKVAIPSTSEPL